ncbi:MAG: hypothetical protein ACTHU0_18375 [Kofleriaceae bacterium]
MNVGVYCRFETGSRTPGGRWAASIEFMTAGAVGATSWYQPAASIAVGAHQ